MCMSYLQTVQGLRSCFTRVISIPPYGIYVPQRIVLDIKHFEYLVQWQDIRNESTSTFGGELEVPHLTVWYMGLIST